MSDTSTLSRLGFKFGRSGAHDARTLMLTELHTLLTLISPDATPAVYCTAIIEDNILGKSTHKARQLTNAHLRELYGLDPALPLFRVFRQLWQSDIEAQPVLALTLALARDPLLRASQAFILNLTPGAIIQRADTEAVLMQAYPHRFSPASIRSYAQNINSTWTQAGYLSGRVRKTRVLPTITPSNVSYGLFLAALEGVSGERLFYSSWAGLLEGRLERLFELTEAAARRGLLVFRRAGGIIEVTFPDYLTAEEKEWLS